MELYLYIICFITYSIKKYFYKILCQAGVNVCTMYVSERNKVSDCKIACKLERESLKLVLYNKAYVFTFADQLSVGLFVSM